MKTFLSAIILAAALINSLADETSAVSPSVAKDSRCFELRTYHAAPGKLEALNARFRDHTCALFKKHGFEMVGFWIPADADKGANRTLVYLLVFPSREAAKKSWAAFGSDPEWKKAQQASEANGPLVTKVDSVYLNATDYSLIK